MTVAQRLDAALANIDNKILEDNLSDDVLHYLIELRSYVQQAKGVTSGGGGGEVSGSVSISESALPTGAATESTLDAIAESVARGTAVEGAVMPTGGTGWFGWLTGIFLRLGVLNNIHASVGTPSDSAATTDTGTFNLTRLVKRALQRLSNLHAVVATGSWAGGSANNASVTGSIVEPGAGNAIYLKSVVFSYSASVSGPRNLTVTNALGNVVDLDVTSGGPGPVNIGHLCTENTAVTFTLPASGESDNFGRLRIYYAIVSTGI
jgi:hypothetical protein